MAMKNSTSFTDQVYRGYRRSRSDMTRGMFSTSGFLFFHGHRLQVYNVELGESGDLQHCQNGNRTGRGTHP